MICPRCGNRKDSDYLYQCKICAEVFCQHCAGSLGARLAKNLVGIGGVGEKSRKCPECQSAEKIRLGMLGLM